MLKMLRWRSAGWAVAALVVVTSGGVGIAYAAGTLAPGPGNNYVGCVVPKSGAINIVSSASQCVKGSSVVYLAGSQVPQDVSVSCPAQSVQSAIDAAPVNLPLTVTITGTCTENVSIHRNDVSLRKPMGPGPAAGITAADPGSPVIEVAGTGIGVGGLTLTGGSAGLQVDSGASVTNASGLTITGSGEGVAVTSGHLDLSDSTISNATAFGMNLMSGAVANANNVTIDGSGQNGVFIWNGSTINLNQSSIGTSGGIGVMVQDGAIANIQTVNVHDNGAMGVGATEGSHVTLQGGTTIQSNQGDGVDINGGSSVAFQDNNVISHNSGSGVWIGDTSMGGFGPDGLDSNTVSDNAHYGITCAGAPSVAMITGSPGTVSGNGFGQVNCPVGS